MDLVAVLRYDKYSLTGCFYQYLILTRLQSGVLVQASLAGSD